MADARHPGRTARAQRRRPQPSTPTRSGSTSRALRAALADGRHGDATIDADMTLARQLGARSTPTFYVSGRVVEGAVDADYFSMQVDDALERAEAALAAGTPPADLYEALLRDASEEAVYREDH
ncbi:MAG: thioredoxin domain-containing protein [Sandaracinaceae bacterium]